MTGYSQDDKAGITAQLVGRRVVAVGAPGSEAVGAPGTLTLDDGTTLTITPNDGGCSCGAGDYWLTELNTCTNAIMAVEFDDSPSGDYDDSPSGDYDEGEGAYRIFVLAENERIKLMEIQGSDGNGYYGTGYWIEVSK